MKYRVIRDCFGFKKRYWKQGDIVEFPDNEEVPCHFEKLLRDVVAPEPVKETMALSELGKIPVATTGFMAGVNKPEVTVERKKPGRPKK